MKKKSSKKISIDWAIWIDAATAVFLTAAAFCQDNPEVEPWMLINAGWAVRSFYQGFILRTRGAIIKVQQELLISQEVHRLETDKEETIKSENV